VKNALRLVGKGNDVSVVINGAGAAGMATAELLRAYGIKNITMCNSKGELNTGASLSQVIKNADVFLGLSAAKCVTVDMVKSMNDNAIVLAMANPVPEIMPDEARAGGAAIIGTGRSDFPNQINNVLAFPGVFRGVLDARAREITQKMKLAAAKAIADYITPTAEFILPPALDKGVATAVAQEVMKSI
jgi:malate dehydrogenase (oxaloacetate-decarboxylating)